jgi:hypothetical protein
MHHPAGRRHDVEFEVPLCQACHSQHTEMLRRAEVDMSYKRNAVERVRQALKGTAVFLVLLAEALRRWAESLTQSEEKD